MKSLIQMLAFDLGSSGGRAQWGLFDGKTVKIEEIHRFPNVPVRLGERWYWDILRIFDEITHGLRIAASHAGEDDFSVGIDTWGVDYGLLDASGELMSHIHHYRDARTDGLYEEIFCKIPKADIYQRTGVMFIQLNTLVQLYADLRDRPWLLANACDLLFVPDLFNYLLTGERFSEMTIASTSQFFNPAAKTWEHSIFNALELPTRLLQPIIEPGTPISPLKSEIRRDFGIKGRADLIAVGSHDTASAWAATPIEKETSAAFISLGTWSLLGMELDAPNFSDASLTANFTNECGVDGTTVYHKILGGLWLIQECRRYWQETGNSLAYTEIHQAAAAAAPLQFLLDPDDPQFLNPSRMPEAITTYFTGLKLPAPESIPQVSRSIYESLALNYRHTINLMEKITQHPMKVIHIVGGGSQAQLLCQFTANATGKRVIAGPVEATTIGNMLMQLKARGAIENLSEGRQIVRRSFALKRYEPEERTAWEDAYGRFVNLKEERG